MILGYARALNTDYEPKDEDGYRFQFIGAFNDSVRMGYAWNYGLVDDQWYRFQARYNLYKRSHYYDDADNLAGQVACATVATTQTPTGTASTDPNRDNNHNGTADECEQVTSLTGQPGSQCDVFKQRCTLPYAVRETVTIPWYLNGNTDEDLFEATMWAVQE